MDLVTLNLYQFASFGQFPSKLRFYHQNLPGYLNISNVVSFWDTLFFKIPEFLRLKLNENNEILYKYFIDLEGAYKLDKFDELPWEEKWPRDVRKCTEFHLQEYNWYCIFALL